MVVEAQWDRPNAVRATGDGLSRGGLRGETIMASMGSLGHYMQELSQSGFALRDFLHEGNGDIWLNALTRPRPFVGWILIEEKAEGGDMLAAIARENPRFLDGILARVRRRRPRAVSADRQPVGVAQNRTLNVARYDQPPRSIVSPAKP